MASQCPYPNLIEVGYEGGCVSKICPARDDCAGPTDQDIEAALSDAPEWMAVLDGLEHRVNAVERELSELKRALTLWVESMEGADRGRD